MKTILFVTLLATAIFGVGGAWTIQGASSTIVTSYEYSSHAGILP